MFKQWFLIGLGLSCGAVPPFFLIWHTMSFTADKYRRWSMIREQHRAMRENQLQAGGQLSSMAGIQAKGRSPFQ